MVNHNFNFYLTLVLMFFSVFAQVKDLGSSTCLIKQSEDTSLRNSQNSIYSEKKYRNFTSASNDFDDVVSFTEYEYEHNNSYMTANPVMDNDYFFYDEYKVTINGSLTKRSSIDDYDYYLLKIDRNAHVNIDLHLEQNLLYEFYIYGLDTLVGDNLDYLYRLENQLYAFKGSDINHAYENDFNVGNYFIILKSNFDRGFVNSFINYDLNIFVQKEEIKDPINLYDLKVNKGLDGAIWVNNILPGKVSPFLLLKDDIMIYDGSFGGENTRDFLAEDLIEINENIPALTLYLFDTEIKKSMLAFMQEVCHLIDELYDENRYFANISMQIDDITNQIMFYVDGILFLADFIVDTTILQIISMLGEFICSQIAYAYMPKDTEQIETFRTLCQTATSALSFAVNSDEIFKLTFNYDVFNSGGNVYVRYIPDIPSTSDFSSVYIVEENEIEYYKGAWYKNGEIYELFNWNSNSSDDSENPLINLSLLTPVSEIEYIDPIYRNAVLDNSYAFNLGRGEYVWYKFVPETSGNYYIMAHAEQGDEIVVELCSDIFPGYFNSEKIIKTYRGGYQSEDNLNDTGTLFKHFLNEGQAIYFRVYGESFSKIFNPVIFMITDSFPNNVIHDHVYASLYEYIDNVYHYAYCDCGERIKENHEATTSIAPGADGRLGLLISTCKKCWHRIQLFAVNPHIIIGKNIVVDDLTEIDAYFKNLRTVN